MSRQSIARKVAAALSLGTSLMLTSTAFAQVTLFPDQCRAALTIAEEIKQNYDISPRLLASFERFRTSNCDIDTKFERDTRIDVQAFGDFKIKYEIWRTCTDNPLSKACQ